MSDFTWKGVIVMATTTSTHYFMVGDDVTDSGTFTELSEVYAVAYQYNVSAPSGRMIHIQVHTTEKRNPRAMGVKSISSPKCWCGATAHFVRDASDASDYGFVCPSHTSDFFASIVPFVP